MVAPTNTQLAAQVAATLQKINEREAQYRDWLAGTATGGPNGDGRYPVTNMSGDTFLLRSLASIVDTVEGPAGKSVEAQQASEAARDAAVTAQNKATQDSLVSNEARVEAGQSRDLAKQYRDDAAAYAYNLQVTRDATQGMSETAQAARDEAVAAKDTSVEARDTTLAARAEAVTARDEAQGFAESINPGVLATKADLQTEVARLVGQAPETMNALDELAAALGNDPNFATTIASQLAAKAPKIHSHVLADIIGLQSALDGKSDVHTHPYLPLTGGKIIGAVDVGAANGHLIQLTNDGAIEITRAGSYAYIDFKGSLADDYDVRFQAVGKQMTVVAAGGFLVNGTPVMPCYNGDWIRTPDGKNRLYFQQNGTTFFGTSGQFEWRNGSDATVAILESGGNFNAKGNLYVGWGTNATYIYMRDDDEGERAIHCNGNRIGFLNQGGGWGAYCEDNGNWGTDGDLHAQGSLYVSKNNATGGGIVLADDGDIVDLNTGYCALRFSSGVQIYSGNRGGFAQITLGSNGNIAANGDITAFSDERLKSDIRSIGNALEKIERLRGTMYIKDDRRSLGVIAQEVRRVFPEVVHEDERGYLSVAYGNLIAPLIEAVKELAERVRFLEAYA
ncbi:tail fiber domain-containing protein [Novosphingobium lindaniclasticum]|uniref:Peptidase S74 domain-containing protein n=1 Tax=Novosphingobium lindaniclasticum LE124 TaxID=1096930 RepID=T0H8K3_9SPHN|nr:tail fiber domain-containing protein [Novosphingobium lindaniclasticum]EQB12686.1 hypothetical protein L284_15035 [Novosphingobium lindaniclasticum LE124]